MKPEKKTREYWDFKECSDYICESLGFFNLGDIYGKYIGNPEAEYKNFKVLVMKNNNYKMSQTFIKIEPESFPAWARFIAEKFVEEFGKEYWIS